MSRKRPNLSERMGALEERQTVTERQLDEIVEVLWPEAVRFAEVHGHVGALFELLKKNWREMDRGYTVQDLERVRRLFWLKMNTAAENGIREVDWKLILEETFADVGMDVHDRDFEHFMAQNFGEPGP